MSVERIHVEYAHAPGVWDPCGRLGLDGRRILFEYDPDFELDLSPLRMPLRRGVVIGQADVFDGLTGLFDDSIPDGWGGMLIDRRLARWGGDDALTPLDRLREVGYRAIGALRYHGDNSTKDPPPVDVSILAQHVEAVQNGDVGSHLEVLTWLGGALRGRQPKALIQIAPNGDTLYGAGAIYPDCSAWVVKFRAPGDDVDSAQLDHAYCLMAKAAGLDVPRTQLLCATPESPGHFAIERFDRLRGGCIHTHTLGGLLHLPRGPSGLQYRDVLEVTRRLTRNEAAVAQMFRRTCFDVFAHNRDVHSRSFSFLMNGDGEWRPSPAYGLTFSPGPEHAMPIAGEARAPDASHLRILGRSMDLKRTDRIIAEVRDAITRFSAIADEAGVPARLRRKVVERLGAAND